MGVREGAGGRKELVEGGGFWVEGVTLLGTGWVECLRGPLTDGSMDGLLSGDGSTASLQKATGS